MCLKPSIYWGRVVHLFFGLKPPQGLMRLCSSCGCLASLRFYRYLSTISSSAASASASSSPINIIITITHHHHHHHDHDTWYHDHDRHHCHHHRRRRHHHRHHPHRHQKHQHKHHLSRVNQLYCHSSGNSLNTWSNPLQPTLRKTSIINLCEESQALTQDSGQNAFPSIFVSPEHETYHEA